jgi:hypothetical protein
MEQGKQFDVLEANGKPAKRQEEAGHAAREHTVEEWKRDGGIASESEVKEPPEETRLRRHARLNRRATNRSRVAATFLPNSQPRMSSLRERTD